MSVELVAYALGVLTMGACSVFGAIAGEHAERQRRIRLAVLRSRKVIA